MMDVQTAIFGEEATFTPRRNRPVPVATPDVQLSLFALSATDSGQFEGQTETIDILGELTEEVPAEQPAPAAGSNRARLVQLVTSCPTPVLVTMQHMAAAQFRANVDVATGDAAELQAASLVLDAVEDELAGRGIAVCAACGLAGHAETACSEL